MKYLSGLILFLGFYGNAQTISNTTDVETQVFADRGNLPFWMFTNQHGRIDPFTNFTGLLSNSTNFKLSETSGLEIGAGFLYQDGLSDDLQIDQLYLGFKNSWLNAKAGTFHDSQKFDGLSTTNGNILWSSNTRAIPGLLLESARPISIFKGIGLEWGIGHYELIDDRFVDGANIHYKRLGAIIDFNPKSRLSVAIQHYAQWGGNSPTFGEQPDGLGDYIDIFFARRSGEENAPEGEQVNALGNHLGSYNLDYFYKFRSWSVQLYHQHLFEDGSGTAFKNFPDGVWGAYIKPKTSTFKSFLYEFAYTKDQSGLRSRSGGDNYFNNSIYRSGWRYEGRTIGLPFITPNSIENGPGNNRIVAHHIGATAAYKRFTSLFKASHVTSYGTYSSPFPTPEESVYLLGKIDYNSNFGTITLQGGADFSRLNSNRYAIGIGYRYSFQIPKNALN